MLACARVSKLINGAVDAITIRPVHPRDIRRFAEKLESTA
jgi:hypothetical protein